MIERIVFSLRELWRKPSHTLLTVLSLAAGIATLTALLAVGRGASAAAQAELDAMGLSGFSVKAEDGVLNEEALNAVRTLTSVKTATPVCLLSAVADFGGVPTPVVLCGIDETASATVGITCQSGRLPARADRTGTHLCCTMEEAAARAAFGASATGRTLAVAVGGREYALSVIGVARAKSSLMQNLTGNVPPLLLMPYTTLWALTGDERFDRLAVQTDSTAAAPQLRYALAFVGTVTVDTLAVQEERLTTLLSLIRGILALAGVAAAAAAGCTLLMTQLTAVSERVPEIGLKKALGASRSRIAAEALFSCAVLSFGGAVIGITVGGAAATVGLRAAGIAFSPSIARGAALLLLLVAFGTLCGVAPAVKAARLSPQEAFCKW